MGQEDRLGTHVLKIARAVACFIVSHCMAGLHSLIIRVEATPVDGVEFERGYLASVEEDLAAGIELVMVADNVGLVSHAFPGGLVDEFDQFLLGELTLGGRTYVFFAQLIAKINPILIDEAWQRSPDVALGSVDVPDDRCHLLGFSESVDIRKFLVLLQELFDRVVDVSGEVGREP